MCTILNADPVCFSFNEFQDRGCSVIPYGFDQRVLMRELNSSNKNKNRKKVAHTQI